MILKKEESLDEIDVKDYKIIQPEAGFKYGIDAVLLANFVKPKKNDSGVDLGSGTGIIPLIIIGKSHVKNIIGVEIQEEVWNSSVRTAQLNGLDKQLEFIQADIKEIEQYLPKHSFDFVTSNPPYYKANTLSSPNDKKNISRHEFLVNHMDIFRAASYLLKANKAFYLIQKPERLVELLEDARKFDLEPKEIQYIYPNKTKATNLLMIKYVKYGNPGLKHHPPLYVYDEKGQYTEEIKAIYAKDYIGE